MKTKTFIILLLCCLILGGGTYYLFMNDRTSGTGSKVGESIFKTLPLNDIEAISIHGPKETSSMKKKDVWVVENRYAYPADFGKIVDFLKKIRGLKTGRVFEGSDETVKRLSLLSPENEKGSEEQKGTLVRLTSKNGKDISTFVIGNAREKGGGTYIRMVDTKRIYLVDKNLSYTQTDPGQWIEKKLLDVNAADIESVECLDTEKNKVIYTLKRKEKGKEPELINAPAGKKILSSKIQDVVRALSSFRIDDVADPAKKVKPSRYRLDFFLYDGTIYHVFPSGPAEGKTDKFLLRAEVEFKAVEPETKEAAQKDTGEQAKPSDEKSVAKSEKPEVSPEKLAADAAKLNKRIKPWTFIVSKWKNDNLVTDLDLFFEKDQEKKPEG